MADPKTQEPKTNEPPEPTPPSGDAGGQPDQPTENWRNEPGAKAMAKQISDWKTKFETLESEIKQREDEAKRKRLEEEGKFKELAETEKRKREEAEASYKAKERRLTLEAKLAGITNELAREGAIARCGPDADIEEYVAKIRKEHPDLWKAPGVSASAEPAQGEQSTGGQSDEWTTVNKDYNSGDPKLVTPAELKLNKYRQEHNGEYPPGNWS